MTDTNPRQGTSDPQPPLAQRPPRLRAVNVSKTFSQRPVLASLNLTIEAGEVRALVGENGSGKSTFIKILAGYHLPDAGGEVWIDGVRLKPGSSHASQLAGCRFVHQDLGLIDSLSVLDNLSLNTGFVAKFGTIMTRSSRRAADEDLGRVGLHIDPRTPVAELSPAARTGVAVARALRGASGAEAKLLILDEPTATLPSTEVRQLLAIVRSAAKGGVGVLYVTHRLDEIFEIADNVTVLRDGYQVADRAVSSLDRRQLITLLVGSELEDVHRASATVRPESATPILQVEKLAAPFVQSVSFQAAQSEIVGIAGITGSGRETILSAIFGAVARAGGRVTVDGIEVTPGRPDRAMAAGVAFLPADRKNLAGIMNLTARENLIIAHLKPFWRWGALHRGAERHETRSWFERFFIRPYMGVEQQLSTFSGGNQQKILFSKWFRRKPRVILLDEPTQGVDIGAKHELHRQILTAAAAGATVVVSSSDGDELAALCHRVLVLRSGRIAADLRQDSLTVAHLSRASLGAELGEVGVE